MDLNVLHNITYGMYIVSSNKDKAINGQIANTVFQITNNPITIAVSINKQNLTHEYIENSSRYCISILEESTPFTFIGKFGFKSGRNEDKFKDVNFIKLGSGCPVVIDNTISYMEVEVKNKLDCGSHTIFLGELTESKALKAGKPMTYDYYHNVIKGKTPKTAPTFIKKDNL